VGSVEFTNVRFAVSSVWAGQCSAVTQRRGKQEDNRSTTGQNFATNEQTHTVYTQKHESVGMVVMQGKAGKQSVGVWAGLCSEKSEKTGEERRGHLKPIRIHLHHRRVHSQPTQATQSKLARLCYLLLSLPFKFPLPHKPLTHLASSPTQSSHSLIHADTLALTPCKQDTRLNKLQLRQVDKQHLIPINHHVTTRDPAYRSLLSCSALSTVQ